MAGAEADPALPPEPAGRRGTTGIVDPNGSFPDVREPDLTISQHKIITSGCRPGSYRYMRLMRMILRSFFIGASGNYYRKDYK